MVRVLFFFLIFFSLQPLGIAADNSLILTPYDALLLARRQSVDVFLAREKVRQATLKLKEAQSVLYPQLMGTASQYRATRNLEAQGITIPGLDPLVGPFNTFDARIKLMQSLFDATAISTISYLRSQEDVSKFEEMRSKQSIVALVASLYFEAQRSQERLDLAKALLRSDQKNLEVLNVGYHSGSSDLLSRSLGQSQTTTTLEKLNFLKAQAQNRMGDLLVALGLPPDKKITFKSDSFHLEAPSSLTEEEIKQNIRSHPELKIAQARLNQARADKKVQLAGFFPVVSAKADYGASGTTPADSRATYTYGAELNLPFEQGGLKIHRVKEAESRMRQAQSTLNDTENRVLNEALKAKEMVQSATNSLKSAKAAYQTAQQEYEVNKQKSQLGLGSENDRIQSAARQALAKDEFNEARVTYELAQLNLAYTLGRMDDYLDRIEARKNDEKNH